MTLANPHAERPLLARHPGLGLAASLLGGLVFAVLAFNVVTNGPLLAWDIPISQYLHARATHDFIIAFNAMIFTGTLGRETALIVTVLLGLYWFIKRHWHELTMLTIGVIGGNIWFEVLSHLFGRHRPVFPDPLDLLPNPGFPSGHSLTAVMLYGLILYLLLPHLPSKRWQILATLEAIALPLLVGYSRLYMGSHYFTDVLGGYAFAFLWAGLVYTGIDLLFASRLAKPKRKLLDIRWPVE